MKKNAMSGEGLGTSNGVEWPESYQVMHKVCRLATKKELHFRHSAVSSLCGALQEMLGDSSALVVCICGYLMMNQRRIRMQTLNQTDLVLKYTYLGDS